jgi:hypothetical protein
MPLQPQLLLIWLLLQRQHHLLQPMQMLTPAQKPTVQQS